jgi:hypothetical protein
MVYSITYRKNNETVVIPEWIVPTGWGETAIIESFNKQYPQAQLISIEPCE